MVDLNEANQYIQSIQTLIIDPRNKFAYAGYKDQFAQSLMFERPLPEPPQLFVFNQTAALQGFVQYSDALQAAVDTLGPDPAPYDFMLYVTKIQAQAIVPPAPPVIPPGQDPVGPFSGGTWVINGATMPTAYTVVGDSSPLGTKSTDARGTFQKVGGASPMGMSYEWVLLPPPGLEPL